MKNLINGEGGFIKWIVIVIIALIILGYYGFDIKKAIEAPTTQSNLTYVQRIVSNVWHNYLKKPATYLWNDVFIELIWNPAMENLKRVSNNEPTTIDEAAPRLVPVQSS